MSTPSTCRCALAGRAAEGHGARRMGFGRWPDSGARATGGRPQVTSISRSARGEGNVDHERDSRYITQYMTQWAGEPGRPLCRCVLLASLAVAAALPAPADQDRAPNFPGILHTNARCSPPRRKAWLPDMRPHRRRSSHPTGCTNCSSRHRARSRCSLAPAGEDESSTAPMPAWRACSCSRPAAIASRWTSPPGSTSWPTAG